MSNWDGSAKANSTDQEQSNQGLLCLQNCGVCSFSDNLYKSQSALFKDKFGNTQKEITSQTD